MFFRFKILFYRVFISILKEYGLGYCVLWLKLEMSDKKIKYDSFL